MNQYQRSHFVSQNYWRPGWRGLLARFLQWFGNWRVRSMIAFMKELIRKYGWWGFKECRIVLTMWRHGAPMNVIEETIAIDIGG